MEQVNQQLKKRLEDAKRRRCWRVVCARIRDIAQNNQFHGMPYEETLKEYNYEYYLRKASR